VRLTGSDRPSQADERKTLSDVILSYSFPIRATILVWKFCASATVRGKLPVHPILSYYKAIASCYELMGCLFFFFLYDTVP